MDASLRCEPGLARWPATMALTRRLETSPCKRAPPSPRVVPASSPRSAATRRPLAPSPQHGRLPCPAPCGANAAAAGAEKDCVTAVASRSPSKLLRHGAGAGRAADAGCTCGVAPGAPQPGSAPHRPAGASPGAAASAARTVGSPCRISAGAGRPPPAAAAASPNKTTAATSNKCTAATNKSLSGPSKIPAGSQKLGSARAVAPAAPHSAVAAATTLSPTAGSHRHRGDGNADASKNRVPSEATKTRSGILPRSGSRPGSRSGRDKVGTGVVKTVCGLGVDSGAGSTNKTGNNPETKPGVVVVTKPGDGVETKPGGGAVTKLGIGMITKAASGVMMKPAGGLLIKLGIGSITKPGDGALTKPGSGLITKAASGVLTRPAGVVLTKSRGGAIAKPVAGALTKPGGGALVKAAGGAGARTAAPVSLSRKQEKEAANARLAEAVTRAEGAAANRRTAVSIQSAAGRTWSGAAPFRTVGPATRPLAGCATGGGSRAPRRNCKAEAFAEARAQGTVHAGKLLQANGDVADDADTGDGETRAAAAAAEEETARDASAEGKAEHDWSGQSKADCDESDTKTKRDESEDSKAELDESHMKVERDESHMKAERDESHMKAERDESHMKAERDESRMKAERDESHMKAERDESHMKAGRDESHMKAECDESHMKAECDESHMKAERDESHMKAECDESHMKAGRDESHMKAERDESHMKAELDESHMKAGRDESHMKAECDESHMKAECDESHMKAERDESHMKAECDESHMKAGRDESHMKAERDESHMKAELDESHMKAECDESHMKAELDESHMKAVCDESHMKAERDESHMKAERDESHMKAERDESRMKAERDESHMKAERDESHMKAGRDESRMKAERDESHMTAECDESHMKAELDESHMKTERDESHMKAKRDESHMKAERDESHMKTERDESHMKAELDESHMKAERDESHMKAERDESHMKVERDESHMKAERDESHMKAERDESHMKAECNESSETKAESDVREQINALSELGAPKAASELIEETKSTYKIGGGRKTACDSHEEETDDVDACGTTESMCDVSGRAKISRDLSGELNASCDLSGGSKTSCAGLEQARDTRQASEQTTARFDASDASARRGVPPAADAAGRQPLPLHSSAEAISDVSVFPGVIPKLNGVGEAFPGAGGVEDGSPLPRPSTTDAGSAAVASGMIDFGMSPVAEDNGAKRDDVLRVGAGASHEPAAGLGDVRAVTPCADLVRVQIHSHANADDACDRTGIDTEIKPAMRADVDKNRALSKDVHSTKFIAGAGPGVRLAELSLCEINLSDTADGASSPSLVDGGGALSDDRSFRETVSVGVMSEAHQLGDELWGCGGTLGDLSTPSSMGLWEKLDSKTSSPTSTPEELKDTGSLAGGASASGSTLGMSPEFGLKLKMLLESRHAPVYEPRDKTERTLAERLKRDTGNNNNVVEGDDDDDEKEDDEDGDDFDNDYYVNDVEKHRTWVLCGIENPAFRDYAAEPDSRAVRVADPRTVRVSGDAGVTAQPELANVRVGDPHPDCSGSVDLTPGRPREPPVTAEWRPPERKSQAEPAATKLGHGWTPDDFEDDDCDVDGGGGSSDGSDADGDDFEVSALTARRAGAALSADPPSHSHFSSGKPLSPIPELDADDPVAAIPTVAGAFEVTRDPDGRDLANPRARRDDGGGASPEPAPPPAPSAPPSRLAASPGRRVYGTPPGSLSGPREGAAAPSRPAPGEGGATGEGSAAGGAAPRGEQEEQEEEEALTRMSEVLPRGRVRPVQGDALTRWSEALLSPLRCEADACVTAVAAFSPDGHRGGQPTTGGPAGEWTIVELESHH